jgi:CIC family chloride channel protein
LPKETLRPFAPASLATPFREKFDEHLGVARHVLLVAAPIGIIVGVAIAGYDYVVNVLLWDSFTHLFSPFALSFLPIAGMLLTGMILAVFRVSSPSMADEVVRAYHSPDKGISYKAAIPKLVASMATMGFGGSAGMEGASKWLGATIASFIQTRLNRIEKASAFHGKVETTLLAGGAAGIGAIFRAPLTGAIMGIESPYKHDLAHEALVHGLVASAFSYATFAALRPATPYFPISFHYVIQPRDLALSLVVGLLAGVLSHVFLGVLSLIKRKSGRSGAPLLVKYLLGGAILTAFALLSLRFLGEPATLQAGLPVANRLLNGHYALWACLFLLAAKLLATAVTFGMGGVGGLFVPSATIGAALGAACDLAFKPSQPGLFTLIGIAAFTGASYNSLLFAAVFVAEATGSPALVVPGLIASSVAFLASTGISNSQSQRSHRHTDDSKLAELLCRDWMTTRIVVAKPDEILADFLRRALTEHSFRALPVVDETGVFLGMASRDALRDFPKETYAQTTVASIADRLSRTVCPTHSMADAERELAAGRYDYVPVVDPLTDQLLGILSSSDVLRARLERTA